MDIEAIVKKQVERYFADSDCEVSDAVRAALTELAAEYEKKIAGLESEAILSRALSERIRQLEALNVAFQHIDKTTHCNDWEKVNAAIAAEGEK